MAELRVLKRALQSPDLTIEEAAAIVQRADALYSEGYRLKITSLAARGRLAGHVRAKYGDALADALLADPAGVRRLVEERLAEPRKTAGV
jgi:hypothetical protein